MLRGSLLTLPQRAREAWRRALTEVLSDQGGRVVRDARAQAPVDTGEFRDGLTSGMATPTRLLIVDRSGYGPDIVSRGRKPWEELVEEPVREMVEEGAVRAILNDILDRLTVR